MKKLSDSLHITGIVNLHFFEFGKDFSTEGEEHPFYELVFVNTGKLFVKSDDYCGTLYKNEMIIHRANTVHSLSCSSDNSPSVIIIGFGCDSPLIDSFSKAPTVLDEYSIKKLAEIVKEGRNVFMPPYNVPVYDMRKKKNQLFASEQTLKILMEYFLIKLIREHMTSEATEEHKESPILTGEIIAYVNQNYKEKITIDELAFIFKTNRATLCKQFKLATGKTLIEYINNKKFEKAKKRIVESTSTFTSIAGELNFESIHYFTRFFKKMSGMSPKEYRKYYSTSKSNSESKDQNN